MKTITLIVILSAGAVAAVHLAGCATPTTPPVPRSWLERTEVTPSYSTDQWDEGSMCGQIGRFGRAAMEARLAGVPKRKALAVLDRDPSGPAWAVVVLRSIVEAAYRGAEPIADPITFGVAQQAVCIKAVEDLQ